MHLPRTYEATKIEPKVSNQFQQYAYVSFQQGHFAVEYKDMTPYEQSHTLLGK